MRVARVSTFRRANVFHLAPCFPKFSVKTKHEFFVLFFFVFFVLFRFGAPARHFESLRPLSMAWRDAFDSRYERLIIFVLFRLFFFSSHIHRRRCFFFLVFFFFSASPVGARPKIFKADSFQKRTKKKRKKRNAKSVIPTSLLISSPSAATMSQWKRVAVESTDLFVALLNERRPSA